MTAKKPNLLLRHPLIKRHEALRHDLQAVGLLDRSHQAAGLLAVILHGVRVRQLTKQLHHVGGNVCGELKKVQNNQGSPLLGYRTDVWNHVAPSRRQQRLQRMKKGCELISEAQS